MAGIEELTVLEPAKELGLDAAEVYELVFSKRLGFSQAPNGRILAPREALDEPRSTFKAPAGKSTGVTPAAPMRLSSAAEARSALCWPGRATD